MKIESNILSTFRFCEELWHDVASKCVELNYRSCYRCTPLERGWLGFATRSKSCSGPHFRNDWLWYGKSSHTPSDQVFGSRRERTASEQSLCCYSTDNVGYSNEQEVDAKCRFLYMDSARICCNVRYICYIMCFKLDFSDLYNAKLILHLLEIFRVLKSNPKVSMKKCLEIKLL